MLGRVRLNIKIAIAVCRVGYNWHTIKSCWAWWKLGHEWKTIKQHFIFAKICYSKGTLPDIIQGIKDEAKKDKQQVSKPSVKTQA